MASYLDNLIAHAGVGVLVETHGERDAQGKMAEVLCELPNKSTLKLLGVVIHQLRVSDEIQDEQGTHLRDEIEDILEIQVPRVQSFGVFDPKTESKFTIAKFPGERFTVLEILSQSEAWAHLRLSRTHVTGIRRGGNERT